MDHHCVECQVCHMFYDVTMNSGYKNKCNKCYMKEYNEKYKEKRSQQQKEWRQNNKEKRKEYNQKYYEKEKKSIFIRIWKQKGLICDDYDQVYQLWFDSTHCDICGCQYTKKNKKSMEHCHTTGAFRGIVCNRCNVNMLDLSKPKHNTSGHKNVSYDKQYNKYVYVKSYYGKKFKKRFKNLSDALCFKYIMLLRIRAGHFD